MVSRRAGVRLAVSAICVLLSAGEARAWILPEHAEITTEATKELEPEEQAVLRELWSAARRAHEGHLCEGLGRAPADSDGAVGCLGFADLPAVAGDHSCTPAELLKEVTTDTWLRDVIEVGNVTETRLREARSFSARINAWSRSNLLLERADGQYASRATSNSGHFVPTAPPGQALDDYLTQALEADEPLNAVGLYVVFHLAALRYAAAYAAAVPQARERWARLAIFSEVFALHFLEDSFSSGHTVGTWGGPAMMKGTHDEYSIKGVPSRSWSGESYSPHGDAHLTPEDLRRARHAVASSLADLTRAVTDGTFRATVVASVGEENADYVFGFDTCKSTELGFAVPKETTIRFARDVWAQTVMPMPGEEHAHMPRFRAEIGPYFAFGAGTDAAATWGGYFTDHPSHARANANALLFVGVGIGLEGAIGIASDGLIELGIGGNYASGQHEPGCDDCGSEEDGAWPSRVPTRSALLFRYRAPYWLIPGDLLLIAPLLLLVDFDTYKSMAIVSANGGVLGLQPILLTSIGTFQFVLGRELNLLLFNDDDRVLSFNGGDPDLASSYSVFEVNSVKLDAPVLAYQPFRSFSNTLTSALGFQLGGAVDIPRGRDVRTGERESPGVAYSVYLRLIMESRWYIGESAP